LSPAGDPPIRRRRVAHRDVMWRVNINGVFVNKKNYFLEKNVCGLRAGEDAWQGMWHARGLPSQ